MRYFIYARKSSESEDRQIQSIDDQLKALKKIADDRGLSIQKIYTESQTAKKPGCRPIFNEMISRIEKGDAEGILCWQINRLSRNPIDSGKISWLLQQGILKSIRTTDREYLPSDNILLFSVESGVANQFILDLSKGIKRGIKSKCEKGWLSGVAPTGYINERENKIIIKDEERFYLVRKMWDLMLTGAYTPPRILDIANNKWGFRTKKFKKCGGRELSRGGIYRIFTNLFYAGILKVNGIEYKGSHESMVTLEEFDKVQMILGRKGKPRPKTHSFAFTGAIRCEVCGCMYTAEEKHRLIKTTGETKKYTYYHCTRRSNKIKCNQKKNKIAEELEQDIDKEIGKLTILPEFLHWALEALNNRNDSEIEDRSKIYEMQHKSLVDTQTQLDELVKMRYRQLIDDEAFLKEKNSLQIKVNELKSQLRGTEVRAENWLELTEKTFVFATYARKAFNSGGLELKKEILMALGKTPTIKDGILKIEPNEWLVPIIKDYPKLEKEYLGLELTKVGSGNTQKEALASIRKRWYTARDSNSEPMA